METVTLRISKHLQDIIMLRGLPGVMQDIEFQLQWICISVVTTQLPGQNGYTGGKVVFIDTEVL